MPRSLILLMAVLAAGILSGCSSSPPTAPEGAGAATSSSRFCQIAVEDVSPKVDRTGRPKLDTASATRRAEEWQASAPDELKAVMAQLVEAASTDPDGPRPLQADIDRWLDATTLVLDRVSRDCPEGAPYWACLSQSAFQPVTKTTGFVKGQAQPQDALTGEPPPGSTRTELSRTSKLVKFGYVDSAGRLVRTVEVRMGAEGWVQGRTTVCKP